MADQPEMTGRLLAGRFRLEHRLGEGGMGSIWRAEHLVLRAPVAVKLIDPEIADDEESAARFMREAQSAAALRSPHVVQIIDYGVDEHLPFIVMELLEGETLAQRLRRIGRLTPQETARIVTHVARAIGRAHEAGIIHRDLKPENVFIVHNEDDEVAKVLDFGVAKVDGNALGVKGSRTRTGSLLGTPYYMSPEQAQGNKSIDHRSDLWSLGVIAFECLTGQRPFYSEGLGDLVLQICVRDLPVPSLIAPVPPAFDAWFARAVARNPDERFQTAREMAEALREALGIESRETSGIIDGMASLAGARQSRPLARTPQLTPQLAASAQALSTPLPGGRPSALSTPVVQQVAIAPTVKMTPDERPSLTVQQFGTSAQREGPHKPGGTGLVLAVAIGALAVGLGAGFALLGDRMLPQTRQQTAAEKRTAAEPHKPALTPPSDTARQPIAPPDSNTSPISDASAAAADAAVARDAALDPAPTSSAAAPVRDEPSQPKAKAAPSDAGAEPDHGKPDAWVKPAWARPDDEPAGSETPDPAPEGNSPY